MNLILKHPAVAAIVAYWTFSAVVGGMPSPTASSSQGYVWAHNSLHILAGNMTAVMQSKFPNLPAGSLQQHSETTTTITPENP